jgi:apolipoprotein N-acyltransferase
VTADAARGSWIRARQALAQSKGARALLSLAAGGLAAVAHPPFGFLPGLLGYGLLMRLADEADPARPLRSAFWRGWLAAFAYFLIGCWWVAEAFMVDARGQGWMAPFAVMLLPAGLGLFWGAAVALYRWIRPQGVLRPLVFAGALTLVEWLRGHVLTGFPWNLPGETWAAGSPVSQAAAVVGAYGLTWITLAAVCAFALPFEAARRREGIIAAAVAALALLAIWVQGAQRMRHSAAPRPGSPIVRIVQPDVPQLAKYDEDNFRSIFDSYVDLTAAPAAQQPSIIVWSEGAIPDAANDYMAPGTWTAAAMARALGPGRTLLVGAYRAAGGLAHPIYFNSLIALRAHGATLEVTGVYDKFRLVPFGEYLPAEAILQPMGFKDLTHIGDSFTPGRLPAPIAPSGVPPVQPLICYEALFPDLVRDAIRRGPLRPSWIVNVSNDAWFGVTSGPIQHLNQASYRAIEEGLPIVRVTPNGVSAVIDPYGRVVPGDELQLRKKGLVDAKIPSALNITTYGSLGDLPLAICLIVSVIGCCPALSSRVGIVRRTYRQ